MQDFVDRSGNENAWGPVYKLCMKGKRSTDIVSLNVGDRYTSNWVDSVTVY